MCALTHTTIFLSNGIATVLVYFRKRKYLSKYVKKFGEISNNFEDVDKRHVKPKMNNIKL